MTYVAPSLLAADFSALGAELKKVREAEILHIDIMDGNFVPNLTMGPQVVKALRGKTDQEFDLHLMLRHPPTVRARVPGSRRRLDYLPHRVRRRPPYCAGLH